VGPDRPHFKFKGRTGGDENGSASDRAGGERTLGCV